MARPSGAPAPSLRLLMPTVRSPTPYLVPSSPSVLPTRSPRVKPAAGRLSGVRSRSGSTATSVDRPGLTSPPAISNSEQGEVTDGERWIGCKCRFEIVVERMELVGYQVYAVEKWIVERARPVTVLTVYTGDPSHKACLGTALPTFHLVLDDRLHQIVVTALCPVSTLAPAEAEAEFKTAVQHLRKQDGARPRDTPQGTLMVTSLAHFRSDHTIVHVPNGDFLSVQDRLYSNINLLRLGCSGRSAVTLEEPSDTTKDRFKSTYFLTDEPPPTGVFGSKSHSRTHTRTYSQPIDSLPPAVPEASTLPSSSSHPANVVNPTHPNVSQTGAMGPSRHPHFASYVLELVRLLQAALAICGMFPLMPSYTSVAVFDGLLCDVTIDGLRKWVAEIGDSLVGLEQTERVADPTVIAALLSFVLSTRNKLAAWVPTVTKDPFLHPYEFLHVLSSWAHSQTIASNGSTPPLPAMFVQSGSSNLGVASGNISLSASPIIPSQPFTPVTNSSTMNPSPQMSSPLVPSSSTHLLVTAPNPTACLTLALHKSLLSHHDAKLRHSDSRKVHHVILSKLDPTSDSEATDEERKWLGGRVMGLVGRGRVGVSGSGGGPGSVGAPTTDLGVFIREIVGGRERGRDKEREKERDLERERDKEKLGKDSEIFRERTNEKERIGGSLKALWSGKVEVLGRMRERTEGRGLYRGIERERETDKDKDRLTLSDIDEPVTKNFGDEELAFGGAWSGKVQKRLEMWTGINRSKKSVDLSSPVKPGRRTSSVAIPLSTQSSSSGQVHPASELRGLGVPAVVVSHDNGDEDDFLSSGQVSPASISRTRNPFTLGASTDVSSANLIGSENDQRFNDSLESRGYGYDSGAGEKRQRVPTWNEWERVIGGHGEAWWKARVPRDDIANEGSKVSPRRTRRHTFHGLTSVQHIPVLRTDRMRIDVELCGQILMMRRREAHLEGVIKCLEHLTTTLAYASTALRSAHTTHKPLIDALTSHRPAVSADAAVTSPMVAISPTLPAPRLSAFQAFSPSCLTPVVAALHALPVVPPVPALQYEAAQLRVDDMWASTREVRRKLWELRSTAFGRENVLGVGGHGSRVVGKGTAPRGRRMSKGKERRRWTSQWRLDGTERLVDSLGRTESEAEEERAIIADGEHSEDETDSERESDMKKNRLGDGLEGEREAMGPTWLLRVFMSWGARLGIVKGEADVGGSSVPATREPSPGAILGDSRVGASGS